MIRYVTVITVIMCGFAGGIFGTYQIEPATPAVPNSYAELASIPKDPQGLEAYVFGTISTIDYTEGLLVLDGHDPYNADQSRFLQIAFGPRTTITTSNGQRLAAGDRINAQLLAPDARLEATSIAEVGISI